MTETIVASTNPTKIMVFLQGTTIMHKNAAGVLREERVQQVQDKEISVKDYCSYIPVGNAVGKLNRWESQAAEIIYLSSHEDPKDVECDKKVLARYGFPQGKIFYRQNGEAYKDIAERVMPDILIEDDCESIGDEIEMTYPHVRADLKEHIHSIPVREFAGIDHLPDNVEELY